MFAVWLSLLGGGVWLYSKLLGPFLAKKEKEIDEGLFKLYRTGSNVLSDMTVKGKDLAMRTFSNMVVKELEKKREVEED